MRLFFKIIIILACLLNAFQATAQQSSQYDRKLLRLAEILGSLHYLRNLCGTPTTQWRDRMNNLIKTENPAPARKVRLYAAFNDAYRAFSDNYHSCTQAAIDADTRYIREGRELSSELLKKFGT